mmetsp:Transcript_5088/g.15531  ORF Transcript_5088/g.15531 Transcript_5088/m.15531 type:complete len:224 (+) Transcript_5088:2-673(+)
MWCAVMLSRPSSRSLPLTRPSSTRRCSMRWHSVSVIASLLFVRRPTKVWLRSMCKFGVTLLTHNGMLANRKPSTGSRACCSKATLRTIHRCVPAVVRHCRPCVHPLLPVQALIILLRKQSPLPHWCFRRLMRPASEPSNGCSLTWQCFGNSFPRCASVMVRMQWLLRCWQRATRIHRTRALRHAFEKSFCTLARSEIRSFGDTLTISFSPPLRLRTFLLHRNT